MDAKSALERIKLRAQSAADAAAAAGAATIGSHRKHTLVDVSVQFIKATGLPKMDVMGRADPYFIATIDDKVKFISSVQANTLDPVWNAMWRVKNVPSDGTLKVMVYDKDVGVPRDDYIGVCKSGLEDGTKEMIIEGSFKRRKGTFCAKITTQSASSPTLLPYTFDGPVAYSRHSSPTVGLLTNLDDNGKRLYSTWMVRIKGIQSFLNFPPQHWNTNYAPAQRIFSGPASYALRSSIQAGHRMLYTQSTRNEYGTIETAADAFALFTGGRAASHRIKPAVYTYVITVDDGTLRFSETGAAFFVDFASKHALHANGAEQVRYSGEFHPRPAVTGGWAAFDENARGGGGDDDDTEVRWELVFDNNSGTYAPDKTFLPQVRDLIAHNFPGFAVVALDRSDPELEQSREACRAYGLRCRAGREGLQPNKHQEGEVTL